MATKTRDSANNAIKRKLQQSKEESVLANRETVESHLQILNEQWVRFNQAQDKIDESCGPETSSSEEEARVQAETWYVAALANFHQALRALDVSIANDSQVKIKSHIRLPQMELPSFSGDPTEWLSFNDAFKTMIDGNDSLSKGQKLHYLRSCLKGEALLVINNFKICDTNYDEARSLLRARYDVMRVIVEKHLSAIFGIGKSSTDSAESIKVVLDTVLQHTRALQALGRPVQFWDDWLVHIVVSKLAYETRKQWELSLTDCAMPTFEQLQSFLETRCRSLTLLGSSVSSSQGLNKSPLASVKRTPRSQMPVLHAMEKSNLTVSQSKHEDKILRCLYCNETHTIYTCAEFSRMEPKAKLQFIQGKNACLNCLSIGHFVRKCRSSSSCRVCQMRHHTALHNACNAVATQSTTATPLEASSTAAFTKSPTASVHFSADTANNFAESSDTSPQTPAVVIGPSSLERQSGSGIASHHAAAERAILLATALIRVQDVSGRWQTARVLFDNGSHASFVTEACIQRLRLPKRQSLVLVTGIGGSQGGKSKGEATVTMATTALDCLFKINALILPKITNDLPTSNVKVEDWPHIQGLPLADPQFAKPGPIDLLIGMDEMAQFLNTEVRKGTPGTPVAQKTVFGWVLFGRVGNESPEAAHVHALHCDVQLVRAVSKFWEMEELPQRKHLTAEETYCERYFEDTHRRAQDGRFIVQLPLKQMVPLGDTRAVAVRSFLRLEKRFASDAGLHSSYNSFMRELLEMGHMEPVYDAPQAAFYLPHHPVLKDTSSTTKLRVVFNASVKSSTGYSLNDALMVGPQLQPELFTVLLRFRTHRYAITADVAKMYRQVCVAKQCVDYQRIVWRQNPSEHLQDYRLLRVTYGLASASHLAVKSLQQTAKEAAESRPLAAQVILRDFYMDDLLTGASSIEALKSLQADVSEILLSGCFELRKWATNCKQLVDSFKRKSTHDLFFLSNSQEVRALGLTWNTCSDVFTFEVSLNAPPPLLTKRAFLSDASLLFDPLGFIAPCTIRNKIWFQQLWRADVDWDQPVPTSIAEQYLSHRQDLVTLRSLKLKRWLETDKDDSRSELHVFADASEQAYAAAAYMRTIDAQGAVTATLVSARTKVAPLKTTTLPRLELCAAHLAAKLTRHIAAILGTSVHQTYAWSDSTVTLAWLQSHPSRWSTFVANRVADIQEVLPPECWNHVRSEDNPADCASRGVTPTYLLQHKQWWQGPGWLVEPQGSWQSIAPVRTTDLEARTRKPAVHIALPAEPWELFTKYSSYSKLKRVTAFALRFIHNVRARSLQVPRRSGFLTSDEINQSELVLVKYAQNHSYAKEISLCRANKPIPLRSSILRLQPFLDADDVLRVGGRIKHANISSDMKNPIIIPKDSPLAKLIIQGVHINALHAGPQLMLCILQRRYWVPAARNQIRKIYRACVKCMRLNRLPLQQVMSDLPISRTTYTRCFLRSAVDLAGPYHYKFAVGRGSKSTKGYICSFICMATGAMHLEFVGDLSTAAFLNAYKRFINRRGPCQHMHSDNGTNFVGADKELQAMLKLCTEDEKAAAFFAESQVTWHFNPPSAPHMGGYWETGIKRIKYHLKRALGDVLLSFEEFGTLLSEIEACVNSRPICSLVSEVGEFEALTPGHFLVGEPLKTLPATEPQRAEGTLGQRWHAISAMRQHFWRRWHDEYLVSLQQRAKWFRSAPSLKEDDVVVIFDSRAPPTKWKLARVVSCHPGSDGRVRVVTLKTADGECVRPIAKLCRLPIDSDILS